MKGVISIHGIFSPVDVPNEKIVSKILCLHGQDDPMVPPQRVLDLQNELSDAGADWQVHAYGGTMHAFTNPSANNPDFGTVYNLVNRRATNRSRISSKKCLYKDGSHKTQKTRGAGRKNKSCRSENGIGRKDTSTIKGLANSRPLFDSYFRFMVPPVREDYFCRAYRARPS